MNSSSRRKHFLHEARRQNAGVDTAVIIQHERLVGRLKRIGGEAPSKKSSYRLDAPLGGTKSLSTPSHTQGGTKRGTGK